MPYTKQKDPVTGEPVGVWYINVPTRHGGWVKRSTLTESESLARKYEVMFGVLGPSERCEFDLLDLVVEKKLKVPELYRAYVDKKSEQKIAELRAKHSAPVIVEGPTDLDPLVDEWAIARRGFLRPKTLEHYQFSVRTLIPAGTPFPVTNLTTKYISTWLGELKLAAASKHYAMSGVRHFITWLQEREVLAHDPALGVKRPKLPDPRVRHLWPDQAITLAERQPSPFREFSALLNGSGGDVSLVLALRVRDVDRVHREIRVHDEKQKTEDRDRWIRVADWAWPYVEALLTGKKADDLLFDRSVIDRFKQWHKHKAACRSLEAEAREGMSAAAIERLGRKGASVYHGYTPKDSRHTFAVRLVRSGVPFEIVASQLGHANTKMVVKVYGRFVPRQSERAYWEQRAQAWEKEHRPETQS